MHQRIYYGWWIVVICMVALSMTAGMGFYSIGVFFNPLMEEFGWNRTQISAIVSVYWGFIALTGPLVGRFMDAHGPSRTMLLGLIGSSLFLCLLSFARSLLYFYIIYALLAASHTALSSIPYGYLISRWFHKKRGTAMGITTSGIGLGGLVIAPVSAALIRSFGWRTAYVALGLGVLAIMLPLLAFIKESPESMGLGPDGQAEDDAPAKPLPDAGWTAREAMRTPVFWLASLGFFLIYGTVFGTLSHQVPFIRDMGISPTRAAAIFGFTAAMGVAGKLVFGYLMDKFPPRAVISSCFLMQALGVLILVYTKDLFLLWVFVLVFGFSMGGTATLRPLIVTWLFGLGSYGAVFGATQIFQSMGSSLFPLVAGMIFDATGSYR
ncbi:MAG: MFS transporter, partial [Deltaproteobacteria bacterium]|nr:MFS transporter [Deltaproteobacteria bacterium]